MRQGQTFQKEPWRLLNLVVGGEGGDFVRLAMASLRSGGDFCCTNLLDLFVMLQVESFPLFPMSTVQSFTDLPLAVACS